MREGLAEQLVFLGVAALERRQSPGPILFEALRLGTEAARLAVVNRPPVRRGHAPPDRLSRRIHRTPRRPTPAARSCGGPSGGFAARPRGSPPRRSLCRA